MPEFRPPSFVKPRTYEEIPGSIDALFNAYQQSRRQGFQEAALGRQTRLQELSTRAELAGQGIVYDPNNPEAVGSALLELVAQAKARRGQAARKGEADIRSAEALAQQREAFAGSLSQPGVGLGVITDPETGLQYIPSRKPGGQPQFPPGQILSSEAMIKKSLADDALSNITDIENALSSPNARELVIKAGGSFQRLKSLGDPDAEILSNAIFQAADAEARIKTGAAINQQEMETYFRSLLQPTGTVQGNLDRVRRKKEFFNRTISNITQGKTVSRVQKDQEQVQNRYSKLSDEEIRRQLNAP